MLGPLFDKSTSRQPDPGVAMQRQIELIGAAWGLGGADPGWAPDRDQHVDFAGFAFSDQRVGCPTG